MAVGDIDNGLEQVSEGKVLIRPVGVTLTEGGSDPLGVAGPQWSFRFRANGREAGANISEIPAVTGKSALELPPVISCAGPTPCC